MRLEKILLKSFGCFNRRDFELSEGTNLIFGPNFSGKSTLVNAIFFALTGKPIVPRVAVGALTQGGTNSGTAGVGFCEQGKSYQLFRSTQGEVELRCREGEGWRKIFSGRRAADEDLEMMFDFTHDHLAAATFLREGEIFEFLARQTSHRREILYALLGIDRLIEARERFIEVRRIAKREETRIQDHQRRLQLATVKTHREEIERLQNEVVELEKDYELLSSYNTANGNEVLIFELTEKRSGLEKQMIALARERASSLGGFNDISHIRQTIEAVKAAINDTQQLEAQREKLIREIGSLQNQTELLAETCQTLSQFLESNQGHCPTCHQPVHQVVLKGILEEKQAEKDKFEESLATIQKQLDKNSVDLSTLRKLNQRHQVLQSKIQALERIENQYGEVQSDFNAINGKLRNLQTDDSAKSHASGTTAPGYIREVERRRQTKNKIDGLRKRLLTLNKEEAIITNKLEELERSEAEVNQALRTRLNLELACDAIERTIQAIQRQLLQPAERELRRWLKRMNLFALAQIDLKSQHLLPSLQIDGNDRSLMLLSGSEKVILYLSLKIALSRTLGNPGFFVFDDPTLHLDYGRKQLMIELILKLAEEYQVIVTSNDSDVLKGLDGAHLIETGKVSDDIMEEATTNSSATQSAI